MPQGLVGSTLVSALDVAHKYMLEGTIDGVDQALANRPQSGTANTIGSIYAHAVLSEDHIVNSMLKGGQDLSEQEWAGRTGISEDMPWTSNEALASWYSSVRVDLAQCREFARAVHQSAADFASSLDDDGWAREVEAFSMTLPLAAAFEIYVIGHANSIGGEIAALKGVAGLKGYPF